MIKRPAAVPLITVDPYFSVWSCADKLYNGRTRHWSEKDWPIFAGININGTYYAIAGTDKENRTLLNRITQTSLDITPLSSKYTFENELVKVTIIFTTPLLPDRLDILSRPISYLEYKIDIKNDSINDVQFIFGISSQGCVKDIDQNVEFKRTPFSMCCGNVIQNPLAETGDKITIDWGYLHLCDKNAHICEPPDSNGVYRINCLNEIRYSSRNFSLNKTYNPHSDMPYLYTVRDTLSGVITIAYDEIKPIEYFYDQVNEYYTKYFKSFEDMVNASVEEYEYIKKLCDKFDCELTEQTSKYGKHYEFITSLAFRQAISSHKLIEDNDRNIIFLSKENGSNGCIGTLDVTYPSIPLFLKLNPELVKGMLRPILKYAKTDEWSFDFSPHDVGRYPIANGQVYGNVYGNKLKHQMPIEESGNMLICLAAIKKYKDGDTELFDANKEMLRSWAEYLVNHGYDPVNQLCTDDFTGSLARNCNLSLKAILAIASYSVLSGDKSYMETAKTLAKKWEVDAKSSDGGTRLSFDIDESWSIKYNMVWDNILDFGLFSDNIKKNELKTYKKHINKYGVPLDSRASFTKLDWLMWSTKIYNDEEYLDTICIAITDMINETTDRVPMTDLYDTKTAEFLWFMNRSVVGGLYIHLL